MLKVVSTEATHFATTPLEHIDLSLWNEFQDSLAALLDISLAICDHNGTPLTRPSRENGICDIVKKQSAKGLELYRESYKKAIAKTLQRGEPHIYKCFTNQYIFAIPVILDSNVSVAIIGGHVYLSADDFKEFIKNAPQLGLHEITARELENRVKIIQPKDFFTKPNLVQELAVPFLRSLYLKAFYEKRYYQVQTIIEATAPTLFHKNPEAIYRHIFNALAVLFDVDTASVMEKHDSHTYRTIAAFGSRQSLVSDWAVSDSLGIIKKMAASKRPEGCDNTFDLHKMGLPEGVESLYIFPMLTGDSIFGFLCTFNTKIPLECVKLIALLANQLSFVREGVRSEQAVKKTTHGLDILEDVYKSIASVLDQEELYNAILNRSTELVGAEQGSLMIASNGDAVLTVRASKGIDRSLLENIKVKAGEGISGTVAEKGTPLMVKDIESESFARKNRPRYKTKSFVSIPLKVGSRTIGVINISDKISGEVFSEADLQLLLSFAYYASIALDRGNYYKMSEDLKKISVTDSLTGLFNKNYFQERLFEEIERSKRYNEPFTLFMIDIDDFKAFNDKYGHLAGDDALKRVARAVGDSVRSIDVVSRWGGEEFCVILPYTNKTKAFFTAERIRRSVGDIRFIGGLIPPDVTISVSIGIAEFPADASDIEGLVNKSDKAMYLAKAKGKNAIISYGK